MLKKIHSVYFHCFPNVLLSIKQSSFLQLSLLLTRSSYSICGYTGQLDWFNERNCVIENNTQKKNKTYS